MDGITLGRPTCGVPHCMVSLRSTKDRFCPKHQDQNAVCSIVGCMRKVRPGHRTCDIPDHVSVEDTDTLRRGAAFQHKHRKERAAAARPKTSELVDNSVEPDDAAEVTYEIIGGRAILASPDLPTQGAAARQSIEQTVDTAAQSHSSLLPTTNTTDFALADTQGVASTSPPTTSSGSAPIPGSQAAPLATNGTTAQTPLGSTTLPPGAKKLNAKIGRTRTHNEQIFSGPCGMMHSRDTLYNAEASPAVCVSFLHYIIIVNGC